MPLLQLVPLNTYTMIELFQIAFHPVNIVYTFLLILVILYWLMIIVGAMDFGSFDIDFDFDLDADIDLDAEVSTLGGGNLAGALHFFNFGKLPFMVIMSFIILSAWAVSILANYYLGGGSILFAVGLVFPNLFVGLCLTKVITTPLIPVFEKMETGIDPVDYIGMTCKLILPATVSKMGQAEVLIENSPLLLNVKVDSENIDTLEKGAEAIILRKAKNKHYFIIRRINHEII